MIIKQYQEVLEFVSAVDAYEIGNPIPIYIEHELSIPSKFNINIMDEYCKLNEKKLLDIKEIDNDNIIIGIGSNIIKSVAMLGAKHLKRNLNNYETIDDFISELPDYLTKVTSITLVIEPSYMTVDNQIKIIEAFQKNNGIKPISVPFGIITGKTYTLTCYMLLKNFWLHENRTDKCHIVLDGDIEKSIYNNKFISLCKKDGQVSKLLEIANNEWIDTLSMTTGTLDDCTFMPQELICGNNHYKIKCDGYPAPQCEQGYGCLIKNTTIQSAFELPVKTLFLQGCNSSRFINSSFGPNYDIGYAFLESSICTYIASPRIISTDKNNEKLFVGLISSGKTLGESVQILNNVKIYQGYDAPCHILFGDPCFSFLENEVKYIESDLKEGTFKFDTVISKNQSLMEISLNSLTYKKYFDERAIRVQLESEQNALYFISEKCNGNGINIYLCLEKLVNERISGKIDLDNKIIYIRAHLKRLIANITKEKFVANGISPDKELEKELYSRIIYLSTELQKHSTHTLKEFYKEFENIVSITKKIQFEPIKKILQLIRLNGFNYDAISEKSTKIFDISYNNDSSCLKCGSKTIAIKKRNSIMNDVERIMHICKNCDNVFEYPGDSVLQVEWIMPENFKNDKESDICIRIKNIGEGYVNLTAGVQLNHTFMRENYYIENNQIDLELQPEEVIDWKMKMKFNELSPSVQKFTMVMLADCDFYIFKNNFIPLI